MILYSVVKIVETVEPVLKTTASFFFSELSMILYSVVKIVETVEPVLKTTASFLTLFYT